DDHHIRLVVPVHRLVEDECIYCLVARINIRAKRLVARAPSPMPIKFSSQGRSGPLAGHVGIHADILQVAESKYPRISPRMARWQARGPLNRKPELGFSPAPRCLLTNSLR